MNIDSIKSLPKTKIPLTPFYIELSEMHIHLSSLRNNRIKQLRIKIIHRIVATNDKLFTWTLSSNSYCKHCNAIENIEHLF